MINFYVGQKVVCIDDSTMGAPKELAKDWPIFVQKGEIYTIRWVGRYSTVWNGEQPAVRLEGVYRKHDMPLAAIRFKPLIEKKTDISVFKALLNKSPTRITEDA